MECLEQLGPGPGWDVEKAPVRCQGIRFWAGCVKRHNTCVTSSGWCLGDGTELTGPWERLP